MPEEDGRCERENDSRLDTGRSDDVLVLRDAEDLDMPRSF